MKQLLVAAFLIALLAGRILALEPAQPQAGITGTWVGQYRLDGKTTYFSVILEIQNGSLGGTMSTPLEVDSSRRSLSGATLMGSRLRFQSHPDILTFDGAITGGSITGDVARDKDSGSFVLMHVNRIAANRLDDYVGDYAADQGRLIIIGRSLGSLYFYDLQSGRTGPLFASDETNFFGGPSQGIAYPVDAKVTFNRDGGGAVGSISFSLGGATATFAKRVKLYNSEDVAFENGNVRLSGTLKTPLTEAPYTAIVMLAGSNAQSRYGQDCILGFNADYLARLGFAVLTYDKRGTGGSTGVREDVGLDGDALAGIAMLRKREDIDPKRIGLWGLSQGGMIAPQIAAQTDIAFIVNVSGSVVNGHAQEIERTEMQMRADGFSEGDVREAVLLQTLKFEYARTGKGWDKYQAAFQRDKDRAWFPDPYVGPPSEKDDPAFTVWRTGAGSFSPADYWKRYKHPVLYVLGEFETYSKPSADIAEFKTAMRNAANQDSTIVIIPKAQHTMREAKTGGPKELPYLNRFVPDYFATLRTWMEKNARQN